MTTAAAHTRETATRSRGHTTTTRFFQNKLNVSYNNNSRTNDKNNNNDRARTCIDVQPTGRAPPWLQ